jgi:hypothetical protein
MTFINSRFPTQVGIGAVRRDDIVHVAVIDVCRAWLHIHIGSYNSGFLPKC